MSRAIAAAKPSIENVVAAGHQPTRQSRKQRAQKLIDAPRQSKRLPKHRPASIIASLGCRVSSRLSRRSHPDCRAIRDLASALKSYREGLAIRARLAQSDPGNAGWQRDLSVSYNEVGDV